MATSSHVVVDTGDEREDCGLHRYKHDVLVINRDGASAPTHSVIKLSMSAAVETGVVTQKGSLMHFHVRFGHLGYDTKEECLATRAQISS